jgi:DNA repair protein RecN (Recombination protein N)
MLTSLTIHNVVLIDRLALEGASGLSALTGETGAGKSILLDALGLALGARAEAGLVRHGESQATVSACFDIPAGHPVLKLLKEKDLEAAETLILRRTLGKDGRSKAFVNDAPVGVQLLKEIGAALVEIHGQFETQGLLNPETHGQVLDSFAAIADEVSETRKAWESWRQAREKLEQAIAGIAATRLQEDYLQYTVAELERLNPQPGEESSLAEKRGFLLNREKMREAFEQAADILESERGIQSLLGRLQATLERLAGGAKAPNINSVREAHGAGGKLTAVLEAVNRAQSEIDELACQVEHLKSGGADGNENLEDIEERYFALKECAKKHRCTADDLPRIHEELAQKLRLITHQEDALAEMTGAVGAARKKFIGLAEKISDKRRKAAQKLGKAVNAELPALKLDKAKFAVACLRCEAETDWGPQGFDHVQFVVSTNPQTPAGPLHKIASGGELSRFMLALKLILAETSSIPTLIFDEVDSGIGGATADAVGERLARLSRNYQVLVVTHSPQVAARAAHHWIVAKTEQKGTVITKITPLKILKERQEEIARMLSGAKITTEARAAAAKLLESHAA